MAVPFDNRFRRLKPYPAYKPSGVEWLGEIPSHWEVTRADSLFRYEKIQIEPSTISERSVFHYSIPAIQQTGNGTFESPADIDSAKLQVFGRRVLVSKLNPRKGVVLVAEEKSVPTICSTEFVPLEPRACDLGWAYRLLSSEPTRQRLAAVVRSATRSHQRAEVSEVLKMWHGVPPSSEQRAIAAFLDRETAKIDALISKKERLIELLREKRIALISHAVTKGLDPDAPMKDSGIEWLGEIPTHWEVAGVKHHYTVQLGKMLQNAPYTPDDVEVPYLRAVHVQWFDVQTTDPPTMWASQKEVETFGIAEGDLLVCEGGEGGRCGVVESNVDGYIIQNALHRVRPRERSRNDFLQYTLSTVTATGWFDAINERATIAHFTGEKFNALKIPMPPLPEQRAITALLDHETAKLDGLVAKVEEAIARLKEFRIALISAAVTGRIDVREEAE